MKLGSYELGPNDTEENGIYNGHCEVLGLDVPDNSVDLIFTDPPYPKEFLYLYGWLARWASRVLKPGGWLFAYGAGEHLPTYFLSMAVNNLDYFWTFALLHHGGYPRMWHKRLMSGYKPVLVYTKGKPSYNPWKSTAHSDTMDKRFHEWGQGIGFPLKMIDMLTNNKSIIVDPCCGGGQVPAVCKTLGRKYLAFEINRDTVQIARSRVYEMESPLFTLQHEQMEIG